MKCKYCGFEPMGREELAQMLFEGKDYLDVNGVRTIERCYKLADALLGKVGKKEEGR